MNLKKMPQTLLGFYFPKGLFFIERPFVFALLDESLRVALGIREVSRLRKWLVKRGLGLHALIHRLSSVPVNPVLGTRRKRPSYPEGYQIEKLGTFFPEMPPSKRYFFFF
jgi:hypothetical protein